MSAPEAIYDVLYGFVPITQWEAQIINSPFYQRLRWIRQLGFSNYIFPGAEHNRFSHAIGVMHSMQQMLEALEIAVPPKELNDPKVQTREAVLHRSLRIAALLHDVGSFPFSHAIEYAYIRHGNDQRRARKGPKPLPNSHEHLGSFIIKNTRYEGGITQILEEFKLDPTMISKIIKGDSPYPIANQLMHSDLDADRMDYLIRDAHYTGLAYGRFDRDFILSNLVTFALGKKELGFGIKESAIHAVDDFLISRFSWYSQVIRNRDSAKFDIVSSHVAEEFLKKDLIHQFQDLLSMIEERDERFFWWNDMYFLGRCQEIRAKAYFKSPQVNELIETILFRKAPKTINHPEFAERILSKANGDRHSERMKTVSKVQQIVDEMQDALKKQDGAWILADIPEKDIRFAQPLEEVTKNRKSDNLFEERDPVKIVQKDGSVSLLVETATSLMNHLCHVSHFIPGVYANDKAIEALREKNLVK